MTMGSNKSRKPIVPHKSKLKKDPGVPRLPDLKVRNAEKQRLQQSRALRRSDPDSSMASEPTLSSLALQASTESQSDLDPSSSTSGNTQKTKEQIRKHYVRTLHKVIDESDIVILVLDARDPEGCRSRLVEEEVRRREGEGKKLVFVLNKIDLVPRANAQLWLRHLRHSTPTLPFRSSTQQHQRTNLSSSTAPALLKLLKGYKPSTQSIAVGVVGYPNVGKSSLINSLKRAKVCPVAAQPGHTKDLQAVQIERGIRVIDSPGVVFDDDEQAGANILLRNVVRTEDIDDPIAVVEQILARTEHESLQKIYSLPSFASTLEFLTMLALSSGRLLKGGTPDLISTARQVLADWNMQKIPYFSIPPSIHPSSIPSTIQGTADIAPGAEAVGQAQILTQLGKPFSLEGLFGAADAGAFGSGGDADMDTVNVDGVDDGMEEDGNEMESDDLAPKIPRKRSRSPSPTASSAPGGPPPSLSSAATRTENPRSAKRQKKEVPSYDAPMDEHVRVRTAGANPLSRKVLKREAKRARKVARRMGKDERSGMDVDDVLEQGLQFTFMVGEGGVTT